MANLIRNISQSVQERTIIKTAPDLVVYLEGIPYLINYFIIDQKNGRNYTVVNFNDYVTNFQANYDTDNLIPGCSFQLQVPNYMKHLFQMPGGNNLIQTMMQVQVYAKGYYWANDGSTVLRRVFKGMVSHIGYNDNGKTLEIQVQCQGILHFMELMQVDLAPALQSNSPQPKVPTQTQLAFLNPYLMLLDMFVRATSTEGFYTNTIAGQVSNLNLGPTGAATIPGDIPNAKVTQGAFADAVQSGYIAKWQAILNGIRNEVHLYGLQYKDQPSTIGQTQSSQVKDTEDRVTLPAEASSIMSKNEVEQLQDFVYVTTNTADNEGNQPFPTIRQFTPDQLVGNIQLLNPTFINRLEEIRHILRIITYEGYQDIDGKIIFKPPLYNLDVTFIGSETDTTPAKAGGSSTKSNPATEIYNQNNPFVIYLDEIISEQESEDQAAIRTTRMTVIDNWSTGYQIKGHNELRNVVEYIDVAKLQKFGLREQPSVQAPWFSGDKFGLFAYAVAETVRSNRGYRTYTVTIPMRPELKLGFPCFIPHRDMYGYIKAVSLNYSIGGTATMTLTLDTLRRRPLLPTSHVDDKGVKTQIFTNQPNLVLRWTTSGSVVDQAAALPAVTRKAPQTYLAVTTPAQSGTTPGNQANIGSQSNDATPANIVGSPATLPLTPDQALSDHQHAFQTIRQTTLGISWGTETDSSVANFRIQEDKYTRQTYTLQNGNVVATDKPGATKNGGIFTKQRVVDQDYYHDIRRTLPFTDDKGYELVGPFPWGRWISLRQCIKEFTQDGYISKKTDDQVVGAATVSNVEAFLLAGLGQPSSSGDAASTLQRLLSQIETVTSDNTIIVLNYDSQTSPSDSAVLNAAQPEDENIATRQQLLGTITAGKRLVDVLVSGTISPTKSVKEALLATQSTIPATKFGLTPAPKQAPKDTVPVFSGEDGTA